MTMLAINLDSVGDKWSLLANDTLRLPKTVSANDRVLLYKKRGGEVNFVQTTSVEFTKTESISGVGQEVILIQLRSPQDLESPTSLSAVTCSLELITRFDYPSKHFLRPIRKMSVNDFETIEKQSIFWARSAFGFYLNALPTDRFIEFVRHVAMRSPGLLIESPNFHHLLQIFDAKYRKNDSKRLTSHEFSEFARWIDLFQLKGKSAGLEFNGSIDLDAHCLVTNGEETTEDNAERTRRDLREITKFHPKLSHKRFPP